MHKEVEKYLSLKRKLIVLEYARVFGNSHQPKQSIPGVNLAPKKKPPTKNFVSG
jgi:hypothetical protein